MTPVKEKALELGIPVYQPVKVREPEFMEVLKGLDAEVFVVVAFGQILPKEILETSGSQTGAEGCLSVPGKNGQVTRAEHVKAKALNENMEEYTIEADGLLARCILHECDHLDGILYVERVEGELHDNDEEGEE